MITSELFPFESFPEFELVLALAFVLKISKNPKIDIFNKQILLELIDFASRLNDSFIFNFIQRFMISRQWIDFGTPFPTHHGSTVPNIRNITHIP